MLDNHTKIAFGTEENTLVAVSYEGNYYHVEFDPINGGDCIKK